LPVERFDQSVEYQPVQRSQVKGYSRDQYASGYETYPNYQYGAYRGTYENPYYSQYQGGYNYGPTPRNDVTLNNNPYIGKIKKKIDFWN
jgi:hypothetical protein